MGAAESCAQLTPLPYLFCYALGVAAYYLRAEKLLLGRRAAVALFVMLAAVLLSERWAARLGLSVVELTSLLTFVVLISRPYNSKLGYWLLCSPPMQYLGTISYGIYLSHLLMLGQLSILAPALYALLPTRFAGAVALCCVVSTLTYVLLERPALRLLNLKWPKNNRRTLANAAAAKD